MHHTRFLTLTNGGYLCQVVTVCHVWLFVGETKTGGRSIGASRQPQRVMLHWTCGWLRAQQGLPRYSDSFRICPAEFWSCMPLLRRSERPRSTSLYGFSRQQERGWSHAQHGQS